jgi:metal-responsive CopG/Arc/MetJ family transcriptional regulator
MAKISIYLDEQRLKELDELVDNYPHLTKRSRSALCSYLVEQEAAKQKRQKMIEAAIAVDDFNLGWNEEEQSCVIIDAEVSG